MSRLRTRFLTTIAATAALAGLAAAGGPADDSGFTPIFNGKDLSGWEGDPAIWSVKDGAITGVTTPGLLKYNKFLIWKEG
ncbi:MAG: family 16 glycoside hydrolase, partial [Isosphaeraceae bacterium]